MRRLRNTCAARTGTLPQRCKNRLSRRPVRAGPPRSSVSTTVVLATPVRVGGRDHLFERPGWPRHDRGATVPSLAEEPNTARFPKLQTVGSTATAASIRCAECERPRTDLRRRWRAYRVDLPDDPPAEMFFFCPDCAKAQFEP